MNLVVLLDVHGLFPSPAPLHGTALSRARYPSSAHGWADPPQHDTHPSGLPSKGRHPLGVCPDSCSPPVTAVLASTSLTANSAWQIAQTRGLTGCTMMHTSNPHRGQWTVRRRGSLADSTCPVSRGRSGWPQQRTGGVHSVRSTTPARVDVASTSAWQRLQRNPRMLPMAFLFQSFAGSHNSSGFNLEASHEEHPVPSSWRERPLAGERKVTPPGSTNPKPTPNDQRMWGGVSDPADRGPRYSRRSGKMRVEYPGLGTGADGPEQA